MTGPDLSKAEWVAADWGSTNLRLWLMGPAGEVLTAIADPRGAATLSGPAFEPVLRECLAPVLSCPRVLPLAVVACGMVGARQGWAEAPYITVPAPPVDGSQALRVPGTGTDLEISILPGLCQSDPPDVMRGEETQIGGHLATEPGFDGLICLPGTHSKWARVSGGRVLSFSTHMTGELFALLAEASVLRHSVTRDAWDDDSFEKAAVEMVQRPETLSSALFGIRAQALLQGTGPDICTAHLSGLLIGAEIGAMRRHWTGSPVAVLGAAGISDRYAHVLRAAGAEVTQIGAEAATLRGLTAAYRKMKDQPV